MIKKIALFLLVASVPAFGQLNSVYNATTYAYTTQVTQGNATTGSSSLQANPTAFAQGMPFLPYNINAPITINRNAANAETLTPGPIANCYPNSLTCTLSATFTFKHISGESIQSGTFGLQEALNIAVAAGSGTVLIDASWGAPSGTSLITAAKGSSSVMIQDNRNPSGATFYQWNGTAYVATGGGGGAVSSVFGRTGGVTAASGDYTCAQVTGCATGGIASINGDTTSAQVITGTGGITCTTSGGTTTCNYAGGAGSGSVATAAAHQMGAYLSAGTTISGATGIYSVDPAMNSTQISALFTGLSGSNTVFIPAGSPQLGYTVNGQVPHDFRLGADWFQMPGIACDATQLPGNITITSGSNQSFVGSFLGTGDVGKTFFFFGRTGYGFGSSQYVWTPTMTAYTTVGQLATWSSNAPFSASTQFYYGTDNLAAVNAAMSQASALFPLSIPSGCGILVNGTIPWNNNQVIGGRHLNQGGFVGHAGADVIATTDTSGQTVSNAGVGLKGFYIRAGTEVDATLGYNLYSANGTLTVVPAIYRPAYDHTPLANHPCAPGWFVGCSNGVSATTQNSAVICTPNSITPPAVGATVVFPYGPKVFTSTVSSSAGSCSAGLTARTMAAALPNVSGYTVTQNEWFAGSSVQRTTTTIPGTPTYPFTIQLSNAIKPIPGWPSNFAEHGHAKIQDYEFDYMGADQINNTIVIRKGPATVNGGSGYSGTNTIVALNPCAAKNTFGGTADQPWPVVPTLNSGDSTPSGANWFPGECVGNAGIAFPTANANVFVGSGLVGGYLDDLNISGTAAPGTNSANANGVAGVYVAGNNAFFASHVDNLITSNLQYGFVQGPASSGQHGVASAGPTGFGNTFHNLWMFDAFPLAFVDMQGSVITGMNMNSTEISPYDGTAVGSATCLQVGYTVDEQTGGAVTTTQYDEFIAYGCEPEGGTHIEVLPTVDIEGTHISFDTANFEGIPNVFGGDHLSLKNTYLGLPAIDYGVDNDFGTLDGSNAGYITNVWDLSPQLIEWGKNSKCSAFAGGLGPSIACGSGSVQGYSGRGIEPSVTGSKPYFALGGMITPWMWNNTLGDSMSTNGTADPTAKYWSASATCNLGGGASCQVVHFNGFNGLLFIGPWNQLYDGPYRLDATFKTLSASSSFTLTIQVVDSGSGQCSSGAATLFSGTVNTTTSFTSFNALADMTGHAGCVLKIVYGSGSTTDTVVVDRFNFVPINQAPVPGLPSAPTYPGSCPAGTPVGSWLGAFSSFAYFCDGTTIKRVGIS